MENEHVFNGRYRVDERLAIGGMAIVYRGTDLLLRRRVAIKVLRDQYASDDDFVKRFEYEAQAAAKLSHPNIVNVYDFGREDDAYFIVMELVEGETLASMLHDGARLPESVAIDYATQLAAGLAYAHRQGLLHRDIKPANILVTHDDVVKLGDFGIARAVAENAIGPTQPGMVMGSVAYISPEQAQGKELDARSDLYSLGVVLYQMIVGAIPFRGDSPVAIALKHVTEPAPRLDPVALGISPALASIVERLVEKDPTARFGSAAEVGRALREAREQPAVTVGSARSRADGDAPTSRFEAVRAPQPPPRRSVAPDRPMASNDGDPADAEADDEEHEGGIDLRWIGAVLAFILAVAVGYVAVRGIGAPRDVAVGDFGGQSATQAQQSIVAAGLQPVVQLESSTTVPTDRVIHQDPAAGAKLARGDSVTLFVSSGEPLVSVPDVGGFTTADAQRALEVAKFKTRVSTRFDAKAPKGVVVEVLPAVGAQAREGSTVDLIVSLGPQPVGVPQFVGLSLDAARALAAKSGLTINVDQQTADDLISKNTIVSQATAAGATVVPGATIGVTVSTGPVLVAVPDISGKSPADAAALLQQNGLTPRVQYIVDATNAGGSVVAQDPAAQATVPRRSTVTLSVAVPGTVPDVSNLSLDAAKAAILANGYTVGNVAITQDGSIGTVVRTEPEANAALRPGEAVTIYYHAAAAPPQ